MWTTIPLFNPLVLVMKPHFQWTACWTFVAAAVSQHRRPPNRSGSTREKQVRWGTLGGKQNLAGKPLPSTVVMHLVRDWCKKNFLLDFFSRFAKNMANYWWVFSSFVTSLVFSWQLTRNIAQKLDTILKVLSKRLFWDEIIFETAICFAHVFRHLQVQISMRVQIKAQFALPEQL